MKKALFVAWLLVFFTFLGAAVWKVELRDYWGDGWNGASLTVFVNGLIVLDSITLTTGTGPELHEFNVVHGDQITTSFIYGMSPEFCMYKIINEQNTTVVTLVGGEDMDIQVPLIAEVLTTFSYIISTGTENAGLPVDPNYCYSYSQSIYRRSWLPDELGCNRITGIKYYWRGSVAAVNSAHWTVYIGHAASSMFSSPTDWLPLSSLTLVFDGTVTLPANDTWVPIIFQTGFQYDGSSQLVVAIDENSPGSDIAPLTFYNTPSIAPLSLVYRSNTLNPNPSFPPPATSVLNYYANIIFQFGAPVRLPYSEQFAGPELTPYWAQSYEDSSLENLWSLSDTDYAGGSQPEMMESYDVSGVGTTRLISPPLITAGMNELLLTFKHYFNDYGGGLTAALEYSHDLLNWTSSGWGFNSGGGDLWGEMSVVVPCGSEPITYLAWTLTGNHYQFDHWYLDDVFIRERACDVAVLSLDGLCEVVHHAPFQPQTTLCNNGAEDVTFPARCRIGFTYDATLQVTDLAPGEIRQVSFPPFSPDLYAVYDLCVTAAAADDDYSANDQLTTTFICLDLDTPAYGYRATGDDPGPVAFNLRTPQTVSALAAPPPAFNFLAGADWIRGNWYGVEYDNGTLNTDRYWRVNELTGQMTFLGETGAPLHGLAYDGAHDVLYGTDLHYLYTVNRVDGAATLVGSHSTDDWIIGLAYDNSLGVLYGLGLVYRNLYTIDPATGHASSVGPLGLELNYAQDLCFDQDTHCLFLAGYTIAPDTGHGLYWINTYTGAAFKLGEFPPGEHITGFAIPYGQIPYVQIAWPNLLWWNPVSGAESYKIYGAPGPSGPFELLAETTSTQWTDPVFPLLKRFYHVTAVFSASRQDSLIPDSFRRLSKQAVPANSDPQAGLPPRP